MTASTQCTCARSAGSRTADDVPVAGSPQAPVLICFADGAVFDGTCGYCDQAVNYAFPEVQMCQSFLDIRNAHLWPAEPLRGSTRAKRALHAEVAAESLRGGLRILNDAGHGWLHEERANAVIQAVKDLASRAR
ncbi:hypothetical protein [Streptomyces sp. NPDC101150]|uniref:hypothetical protein n=1 Tax=Streptomyces sp. NPDC101150 TaxID=3366114 RepID=UPI0037F72941